MRTAQDFSVFIAAHISHTGVCGEWLNDVLLHHELVNFGGRSRATKRSHSSITGTRELRESQWSSVNIFSPENRPHQFTYPTSALAGATTAPCASGPGGTADDGETGVVVHC